MVQLASSPEAYQLLHEGVQALSQVEANGARIDVPYLKRVIKETGDTVKELEEEIRSSEIGRVWRREFGQRVNYNSDVQLARVLFDVMKFEPPDRTAKGRYKTDVSSIEKIDHPFVKSYIRMTKLSHAKGTFLMGILKEVVGEYVHVNFNLHTAATYRSSSSAFNYQNLPIRDPELGKTIRSAFIARDGCRIIESDYGGIEVKISTCYHNDPRMITYLKDPSKDMHRDMAAQCFKLSKDEVSKMARYSAKNMFVFPQFYGDYYINCARSMWDFMDHQKLTVEGNEKLTLRKHLKRNGISSLGECDVKEGTEPGTFEHHIKQVEKHFWNTRFPVYRDWKKKWYNDYLAQGYFYTKTGFRIEGNFGRNDVINYPVQGSAFHCLLWSLIQIQKELVKRGMKALIIGQIHDSIVADVPDSEVEEYLAIVKNVMIKRIQKAWKWIIVPLEVEVEMSPIGGTWFDKKKVAI